MQNYNSRGIRILLNPFAYFESIDIGKINIQKNEIRPMAQLLKSLFAACRFEHLKSRMPKNFRPRVAARRIIVDVEDRTFGGEGVFWWLHSLVFFFSGASAEFR